MLLKSFLGIQIAVAIFLSCSCVSSFFFRFLNLFPFGWIAAEMTFHVEAYIGRRKIQTSTVSRQDSAAMQKCVNVIKCVIFLWLWQNAAQMLFPLLHVLLIVDRLLVKVVFSTTGPQYYLLVTSRRSFLFCRRTVSSFASTALASARV